MFHRLAAVGVAVSILLGFRLPVSAQRIEYSKVTPAVLEKRLNSVVDKNPDREKAGLLAIFAELEREILRERTRTGSAQARLNGKPLGRPETAGLQAAEIRKLYQQVPASRDRPPPANRSDLRAPDSGNRP